MRTYSVILKSGVSLHGLIPSNRTKSLVGLWIWAMKNRYGGKSSVVLDFRQTKIAAEEVAVITEEGIDDTYDELGGGDDNECPDCGTRTGHHHNGCSQTLE